MKISVIMPSYLGNYLNAAKDRETKIVRAVDSVLNQSHTDAEVVVIADGCEKTVDIIKANYSGVKNVRGLFIEKQPAWGGGVRNTGLFHATGDVISYLDIDDYYDKNHLKNIAAVMTTGIDWCFHPATIWNGSKWILENAELKMFKCGTANIAHRKSINEWWPERTKYGMDDWYFIRRLMFHKMTYNNFPGYHICHIPNKYDV